MPKEEVVKARQENARPPYVAGAGDGPETHAR